MRGLAVSLPYSRYVVIRDLTIRLPSGPLKLSEGQIVESDGSSIRIGGRVYSGLAVMAALASGRLMPV